MQQHQQQQQQQQHQHTLQSESSATGSTQWAIGSSALFPNRARLQVAEVLFEDAILEFRCVFN